MSKAIKFNLIVDAKPIRTIEQLRENFNIDDILEHYESGVLQRWLQVRDYKECLKKVIEINNQDKIRIAYELVRIFDATKTDEEIKNSLYYLEFRKNKEEQLKHLEKNKFNCIEVVADHYANYKNVLNMIIEKKDDFAYIKQSVKEIETNYLELFEFSHMAFYEKMTKNAPLAIFAALMNESLRNYFIYNPELDKLPDVSATKKAFNLFIKDFFSFQYSSSPHYNKVFIDKVECFMKQFTEQPGFSTINTMLRELGQIGAENSKEVIHTWYDTVAKYLKYVVCTTNDHWKDIEPTGKRYLVLFVGRNCMVRNAGRHGEELKENDVLLKYPILSGIDYKCNTPQVPLIYMEV